MALGYRLPTCNNPHSPAEVSPHRSAGRGHPAETLDCALGRRCPQMPFSGCIAVGPMLLLTIQSLGVRHFSALAIAFWTHSQRAQHSQGAGRAAASAAEALGNSCMTVGQSHRIPEASYRRLCAVFINGAVHTSAARTSHTGAATVGSAGGPSHARCPLILGRKAIAGMQGVFKRRLQHHPLALHIADFWQVLGSSQAGVGPAHLFKNTSVTHSALWPYWAPKTRVLGALANVVSVAGGCDR